MRTTGFIMMIILGVILPFITHAKPGMEIPHMFIGAPMVLAAIYNLIWNRV